MRKKIYTRFKYPILQPREKLQILKGVEFNTPPVSCTLFEEYPRYIVVDIESPKLNYKETGETSHRKIGINKGAMLCGDVEIMRIRDEAILTGDMVAETGTVYVPRREED